MLSYTIKISSFTNGTATAVVTSPGLKNSVRIHLAAPAASVVMAQKTQDIRLSIIRTGKGFMLLFSPSSLQEPIDNWRVFELMCAGVPYDQATEEFFSKIEFNATPKRSEAFQLLSSFFNWIKSALR